MTDMSKVELLLVLALYYFDKGKNIDKFTAKFNQYFKKIFYDVNYTDYLFSLPMGAGKTYLMAAFIYLDLY